LLYKHCKEGTSVVTQFWVTTKQNEKIQKIYIKKYSEEIQKVIGARKGCWNTEKGHNWLKRFKNAKG
jgi:hypothetical protein